MTKRGKNLELTGFNPTTGLMSNEESVQPKITGLDGDQTNNETKVNRNKKVSLSKAYKSNKSRMGAIVCLNLILKKCSASFVNSSASGPATSIVVYPTKGSVGSIVPAPFVFSAKEWEIIVSISKEYEKSPFILRELSLRRHNNAIQHFDEEVYSAYVDAGLLPNENQIVKATTSETSESTTPSGLPSSPIVD